MVAVHLSNGGLSIWLCMISRRPQYYLHTQTTCRIWTLIAHLIQAQLRFKMVRGHQLSLAVKTWFDCQHRVISESQIISLNMPASNTLIRIHSPLEATVE